jgi:hypothetical protein
MRAYEKAAAVVALHPDGITSGEIGKMLGLNQTAVAERLRRAEQHGLVVMEGVTNGARWRPGPLLEEVARLDAAGVPEAPAGEGISWRRGWLAGRRAS